MGSSQSGERDELPDNATCDDKLMYCRESSNFNPKEWDKLNNKCQDGDKDSCDYLQHKYDGEGGSFAQYQQCLQSLGEQCQMSPAIQQEYQQLSEAPSVMNGMLPFVGGMIMGGLMGSMMQSAFQNRQAAMAQQGVNTPYNKPGAAAQHAPTQPKPTGTTDLTKNKPQGAQSQNSVANQQKSGTATQGAQQQRRNPAQGFGKNAQSKPSTGSSSFGQSRSSQGRSGWGSSGGSRGGFGGGRGFGRRR